MRIKRIKPLLKHVPWVALFLLCSGCSLFKSTPDKTRLFEIGFRPRPLTVSSSSCSAICIVLNYFPDYLNRPPLMTKISDHELKSNPCYRWATPLSENLLHILKQSIRQGFPQATVYEFPKDIVAKVDLTLKLDVDTLEIDEVSRQVTLSGVWTFFDGDRVLVDRSDFKFSESFSSHSNVYSESVAKVEEVILQLGDAIVERTARLLKK